MTILANIAIALRLYHRLQRSLIWQSLTDFLKNEPYEVGRRTYGVPVIHHGETSAKLKIGSFCSIARNVTVFLGGEHHTDRLTTYPLDRNLTITKGDVTIGNDVWIGADALILSGVTIGNGAIIGARAVIAKDVPPYALVVGNPGRVIRYRFSQETIDRLQALAWWNWSDEEIERQTPFLMGSDVDKLTIPKAAGM